MAMKYRLAISDIVQVLVAGFIRDANGEEQPFTVKLQCERKLLDPPKAKHAGPDMDPAAVAAQQAAAAQETIDDVLNRVTKGWDQTLVLDEGGQPAAFCAEAFAEMLRIPSFSGIAYMEYLKATGAKQKN